jgi:hypothetical protein
MQANVGSSAGPRVVAALVASDRWKSSPLDATLCSPLSLSLLCAVPCVASLCSEPRRSGRLFYYFVEAEEDPQKKPLLIWLNGGPVRASLCVHACTCPSELTYLARGP